MKLAWLNVFAFACLSVFPLAAQDDEEYPSWLLVVNLYRESVDVQLGDEDPVSFKTLGSGTPSLLSEVDPCRKYELYVKLSSESTWRFFKDDRGEAKKFRFLPTVPYALRIAPDGSFSVLSLSVQQGSGPKVALLNATDQVAGDFLLKPEDGASRVKAPSLGPSDITAFTSLSGASYEASFRVGDVRYGLVGSVPGTEGVLKAEDSRWYLAVAKAASLTEGSSGAPYFIEVWDVSP